MNVDNGLERALQIKQLLHLQASVLDADALQRRTHIEKVLVGEILLLQNAHKLHRLLHLPTNVIEVGRERHITHQPLAQRTQTQRREPTPNLVETYLLFVCIRVNQFLFVLVECKGTIK